MKLKLLKSGFNRILVGIDQQDDVQLAGQFARLEREVLLFEAVHDVEDQVIDIKDGVDNLQAGKRASVGGASKR